MLKSQYKILEKEYLDNDLMNDIFQIELNEFKDSFYNIQELIELKNSKSHFFIIIKKEKELIAYCIYSISEDEINIYKIWVKKQYRRNNIAKEIILLLYNKEEINKIIVDVNNKNEIAKMFYKNMNFKEINVRKKYYKDGSDCICLIKIINNK